MKKYILQEIGADRASYDVENHEEGYNIRILRSWSAPWAMHVQGKLVTKIVDDGNGIRITIPEISKTQYLAYDVAAELFHSLYVYSKLRPTAFCKFKLFKEIE